MAHGTLIFGGRFALLIVAACVAACGVDYGSETKISRTIEWHQDPNSEIQDCHIFRLDNADPIEVDRITVNFPAGSHHVHIYRSDTPEPDSAADCWHGIDWTQWHLVLGAQTQPIDWALPSGLTVPFDPHQQLLVQVHWLNTTEKPIDGKIDITFQATDHFDAHVGVLFGINKQTAMQPHEHKVLRQWCAIPDGAHVLALMGHYHGLGQSYTITAHSNTEATGPTIYQALDDRTFQFKVFDPSYEMASGDGLEFECDFFNTRDIPITWSSDTKTGEHCNMVAYYWPAVDPSTFCITEQTEVRAINSSQPRTAPGDLVTYTVTLTEAAATGGTDVTIVVSDPTALAAPKTVHIPAGETSATFDAHALRPSRVTVTATLGSTSKIATTMIGGLVLSEVLIGTLGQTDNRQWVEITNLSDVPIDLSKYSLGAGTADYTATRLPLTIALPSKGCVVVGGPLTAPGQRAYDQASDFSPDLALSGPSASGVGLFDVTADQIDAHRLPLDALVYGANNTTLLNSSGQLAPVVAPGPASGTYFRDSETRWNTQAVPTPGICEVR